MSPAPHDDAGPDTAATAQLRALLQEHLPGYEPQQVLTVAGGPGEVRSEIDGTLQIEVAAGTDDVARQRLSPSVEAMLLRSLGGLLDVPVPVPVFQQDAPAARAFRMLPGRPLGEQTSPEPQQAIRLARRLGGVLADLHGIDASDTGVNLPIAGGPEFYRASAQRAWEGHSPTDVAAVDPAVQKQVSTFLRQPVPEHPPHPSLCHLDLRPTHLLVDGASELVGITGWSRTAIGDPARDLAAVLLYLGDAALDAALDGYRRAGAVTDDDPDLMARIVFHARCAAVGDLESSVVPSPELW